MAAINRVNVKDFYVHQGQTKNFTIKVKDNNNVAKNLTGYTASMTIRKRVGGAVVLTLTTSSGITLTGATGQLDFVITAAQTAAFDFIESVYDVKLTSGAGTVTYLLRGRIIVDPRVTE